MERGIEVALAADMTTRVLLGLAGLGLGLAAPSTAHALPPIAVPGGESIDVDSDKTDRSGFDTISGDINGDGDEDLLVSGPAGPGVVRAYFGPKSSGNITDDADAEFAGRNAVELGWAMTLADLNEDGVQDVVLAAPSESASFKVGVVYGFYGPIQPASYDLTQADVAIEAPTTSTGAWFGWSLTTGDFDCDGRDDIAVGDRGNTDSVTHVLFETQAGRYELGTQGTRYSEVHGQAFAGAALAAGDFNGDGCDELAIGATGEPWYAIADYSGVVFMLYGRNTWEQTYEMRNVTDTRLEELNIAVFHDQDPGANVGHSVAFGDHRGDGFDDLIIGAPFHQCDGCGSSWRRPGRAFIVEGRIDHISVSGEQNVPQLLGPIDVRLTPSTVGFEGDSVADLYGFDVAYVGTHHAGLWGYAAVGAPGAEKAYLERLPWALPQPICKFDPETQSIVCEDPIVPFQMVQRVGTGFQRYDHSDPDSAFGYSVAGTRISGADDVVVGAPYVMSFGEVPAGSGHAYVFFGSTGSP